MSQPVIHPYENIGTSKFNESLLDTTLGRLSFIARAIPAYTKVFVFVCFVSAAVALRGFHPLDLVKSAFSGWPT